MELRDCADSDGYYLQASKSDIPQDSDITLPVIPNHLFYNINQISTTKKFNYDKDEMWEVFLELYQENYLTQLAKRLI